MNQPLTQTETDLLEAAACLWEAACKLQTINTVVGKAAKTMSEEVGTAQFRLDIALLAPACNAAYEALPEAERSEIAYDCDFVPWWLEQHIASKITPTILAA